MSFVPVLKVVLSVGYVIFEWWLGRTKRTEANSTIDLASRFLKAIVSKENLTKGKQNEQDGH